MDNGLIAAQNNDDIESLLTNLRENFQFKSGKLECYIGIEVTQMSDGSIFINQAGYARRVPKKIKMIECNPVAIPADPNHSMKSEVDFDSKLCPYRQAIGSLIYLATATRPDI